MVVKRGHTIVKIYRTPTKGCDSYTVVHYVGEKRHRKTFADLELAVTEAEVTANKLSTGELDVLTLTSQDRLAYVRAVKASTRLALVKYGAFSSATWRKSCGKPTPCRARDALSALYLSSYPRIRQ